MKVYTSKNLRGHFSQTRDVVIIGNSLSTLVVAYVLAKKGRDVTIIEQTDAQLPVGNWLDAFRHDIRYDRAFFSWGVPPIYFHIPRGLSRHFEPDQFLYGVPYHSVQPWVGSTVKAYEWDQAVSELVSLLGLTPVGDEDAPSGVQVYRYRGDIWEQRLSEVPSISLFTHSRVVGMSQQDGLIRDISAVVSDESGKSVGSFHLYPNTVLYGTNALTTTIDLLRFGILTPAELSPLALQPFVYVICILPTSEAQHLPNRHFLPGVGKHQIPVFCLKSRLNPRMLIRLFCPSSSETLAQLRERPDLSCVAYHVGLKDLHRGHFHQIPKTKKVFLTYGFRRRDKNALIEGCQVFTRHCERLGVSHVMAGVRGLGTPEPVSSFVNRDVNSVGRKDVYLQAHHVLGSLSHVWANKSHAGFPQVTPLKNLDVIDASLVGANPGVPTKLLTATLCYLRYANDQQI